MNTQESQLTDRQKKLIDISMGSLAGLFASVIGAILYALYPFIFGMQLSLLAIGVGILIGIAIHLFGKGESRFLGFVGAFLALASCIAGDVISAVAIYSFQHKAPFFEILVSLNFFSIIDILAQITDFISVMFYLMAMIIAYGISTTPLSPNIPQKNDTTPDEI
jgi:hypothetical protein